MSTDSSSQNPPAPEFVRIGSPPSEFYVHPSGTDATRFIFLFRSVVTRLPAEVCQVLTLYWNPLGPRSPLIVLKPDPVIFTADRTTAGIAMSDGGKKFTFSNPALAEIPDELGQCLIAHELAHAHTDAESFLQILETKEKHAYEDARGSVQKLIALREKYADNRLRSWGFDPDALRQWCQQYLKRHGIEAKV